MNQSEENETNKLCLNPPCIHLEVMTFNTIKRNRCNINKPMYDNCGWYKSVIELKNEIKGGI